MSKGDLVTRAILEGGLLGQQRHEPPPWAHFILLAGVVVTALVLFGLHRWRRRRDQAAARERSSSHGRSVGSGNSTEDE
jgi:hypothetical protein